MSSFIIENTVVIGQQQKKIQIKSAKKKETNKSKRPEKKNWENRQI